MDSLLLLESHLVVGGPITSWVGAAGGFGIPSRMRRFCLGSWEQHFSTLPSYLKTGYTKKSWTILLSILAFGASLLGTFLVRSGVLTSVHTFATDPERGVFILLLFLVVLGGGLLLYAIRAQSLKVGGLFAPISREGALVLNNLFLATSFAVVF